jgi:hypothetical protein
MNTPKKPIDPALRALAMLLARRALERLRAGEIPAPKPKELPRKHPNA